MSFLICFFESDWKICTIEHKTIKEVAAKDVIGLVDRNNTKQADKEETTEMGRKANHRKPKYKEVKRGLCVYSNQIDI